MRISAVAKNFTNANLRLLKQVGVDDFVYLSMDAMPVELDDLARVKTRVERQGLRLSVMEGGPPIDRIVHGKEGRDQQIEEYKKMLLNMGKLGIGVLCYNFMPQVGGGEMVVRTSYRFPERGGAATSQFRLADVTAATVPHNERSTTDEEMWDNLEYFLKRIVPIAEAAEVKLAMHPDDPPLSPLCGLARIMRSVENFERLLHIAPSPVNGLTLCQGCFAEMGAPIPDVIRRFAGRIHFAHFRDVQGTPTDFHETFPDNGPTDMIAAIRAYKEIGYDGFLRIDHVPLLADEEGEYDGYGMHGHLFAIGYLKGLMEPVFGKNIP